MNVSAPCCFVCVYQLLLNGARHHESIFDYDSVLLDVHKLVKLTAVSHMCYTCPEHFHRTQGTDPCFMTRDQLASEHLSFYLVKPKKDKEGVDPVGVYLPARVLDSTEYLHAVDHTSVRNVLETS